ncbi:lens fiber membrane intrinsic protein-like [Pelobates fuscus]|uniref:lens fiber membrane intrinsic protein-like n=1 Tax=Pelobates fuscus TaxID=191477 RepID=UPI002FE48EC7
MTRPSGDASFKMMAAVAALVTFSNLCLLIALVSNYWIYANGRDGVLYLGIWKGCTVDQCYTQTAGVYMKTIFIITFMLAVLLNVVVVLNFKYEFSTIKGYKKYVGKLMLIFAFLEATGMTHASILFILSVFYSSLHYAYFVGWIAVASAFAAGGLSFYHGHIEPEIEDTPTTVQGTTTVKSESPPPYSVMP